VEDLGIDRCIILKGQDARDWTGLIWLRIGIILGSCDHGN
jgi:hypothetical protein